jgi:hypothetical protein
VFLALLVIDPLIRGRKSLEIEWYSPLFRRRKPHEFVSIRGHFQSSAGMGRSPAQPVTVKVTIIG